MTGEGRLIPPHGGYRKLRSFRVAQLVYDGTVIFCDRFVDKRSRTRDQIVQAARSSVQNIAEGSMASATSRKMELKLLGYDWEFLNATADEYVNVLEPLAVAFMGGLVTSTLLTLILIPVLYRIVVRSKPTAPEA